MNTQLTIVAVLVCVGLMALPSSAAVGTFFHLSDWHFDPFYNENFNSDTFCRNETELNDLTGIPIFPASLASNSIHNKDFDHRLKNSPPPHFQFGQFDCDSPLPLLETALSSMVSVDANPTFIIFTGDMSAHHLKLPERRSSAISLGSLHIREAFPNTPIFPSIGNNDCYPDYFLDLPIINRPNEWLVNLWNIWSTYFSIPSSQKKDFTHGGYYVANITQSHILLSLNTIWYSTGHDPAFNTTAIPDPAGQFAWLSAQLTAARTASLGVYIIGHILPTTGEWEEAYLDTYLSIVSQFSDVITGQLFGHTHRDAWARLNDPVSKQLVGSYLVAPSLTPKNSNNPTFRHVFYNTTTAQLLDYDQYYADLMNATLTGLLKFPREYNYQKVYQESSLDTPSIASVINKIANDLVFFNIWNANNDAQYNTKRADNLCAMYFVTEAEQNACIDQLEVYKV